MCALVTGVQTCALPIFGNRRNGAASRGAAEPDRPRRARRAVDPPAGAAVPQVSRRHADALLPDPAAAAGPPAAGADLDVDPLGAAGLRLRVGQPFLEML